MASALSAILTTSVLAFALPNQVFAQSAHGGPSTPGINFYFGGNVLLVHTASGGSTSSTGQVLVGHEAQAGKVLTGYGAQAGKVVAGQQGPGPTLTSSRIDNDYGVVGKIGILP
jgi:hypothetical protein